MTRDEKIAEAARLRSAGWTLLAIAHQLGVCHTTVWQWLNPERAQARNARDNANRAAAKRAWENEHDRPRCACGNLMGAGAHRHGGTRCQTCREEATRAATQQRRERIAALWRDGVPVREMAEKLNSTPNSLGAEMARMRADGWDLPYRRAGWKKTAA